MKKALSIIAVALLVVVVCASFAGCESGLQGITIVENMDYSIVLQDYLVYPDAVNVESIQSRRDASTEDPVDVTAIYNDSSLTDAEKIAEMVYGATMNEVACDHFAYFTSKIGSTTLSGKEGYLIYQRLRRQSDEIKDDTTIKVPVNHNFDSVAAIFVTSADIRYVSNDLYKRMNKSSKGKITYNEKTGLLGVTAWSRQSRENWDKKESAIGSRSYSEARKSTINWKADGIVSDKGAKIEVKTDDNGNKYYELTFSIDVTVANADNNGDDSSIKLLENDNGGSNMKYEYCNFVVQIWECGLAKRYDIDESWSGTIKMYSGSAKNKQVTVFSYSEADMDYSATEAIYKEVKSNL